MKNIIAVDEACTVLGSRLKRARLEKNLTQLELAKLIGVSRGKIVEAEKGYTTTEAFVAIMIALRKDGNLEAILPEETHPSTERVKRPKRQRQRASGNSEYIEEEVSAIDSNATD